VLLNKADRILSHSLLRMVHKNL